MVTKFLNVSTNERLSENSNILVPSQKAVKSYIASKSIQCDYVQSETPTGYSTGQLWLNTSDCKIYTATSGSAWNSGVAAEKDQLFTCNDLLYYYDGSDIKSYTILSILEQNENREIKTWLGTRQEYDELDSDEYDSNTIYQVIETLNDYARLATQTEFNNSSATTASTPYQVNQKLGNYLPLSGGNLNPSAVLRLTNSNNEVTTLAFNTSGQLTISSDIYGDGQLNINNIVVRNGTIYKTNTSGATAIWSDTYATSSNFGIVKVDGTTITANNGVISTATATADYVIERGGNSAAWYEIWKSGRLVQGGFYLGGSSYGIATIGYLKPFNENSYTLIVGGGIIDASWAAGTAGTVQDAVTDVAGVIFSRDTTYFTTQAVNARSWLAIGWLAS